MDVWKHDGHFDEFLLQLRTSDGRLSRLVWILASSELSLSLSYGKQLSLGHLHSCCFSVKRQHKWKEGTWHLSAGSTVS